MTLVHVDDTGAPCARHPAGNGDSLHQLAAYGSRMASFNHDIASKIQALMMAIDELGELVEPSGDADLTRVADNARESLRELNQLLTTNRALTKPSVKTTVALRDVLVSAGARAGVRLVGTPPDGAADLAAPFAIQALALAIDVAAGTGRSRSLAYTADGSQLAFTLATTAADHASESLALATWMLARDGGTLCCTASGQLLVRFGA